MRNVLRWLFCATLAGILTLQRLALNESLTTPSTPRALVSLELAPPASMARIVGEWTRRGALESAQVSVALGLVQYIAWTFVAWFGIDVVRGSNRSPRADVIASWIRRIVLAAGALQLVASLLLWRVLGGATPTLARVITLSAVVRYGTAVVVLCWGIVALGQRLAARRPTPLKSPR